MRCRRHRELSEGVEPPAIEGRLLDPAGQLRADKTSLTVSRKAESFSQCKRYDRCIAPRQSRILVPMDTVCSGGNGTVIPRQQLTTNSYDARPGVRS
jgi:hypothetical protein